MVKFGIIGLGNMGEGHISNFENKRIKKAELVAVCDIDETKKEKFPKYKFFTDYKEMIKSGEIDAVIVATPHYSHTYIGAYCLEAGIHTVVEKPISVHKADCLKLIEAHKDKKVVFSAMFNQRTIPNHKKIKELIPTLGEIRRVNYIITDWFRSQAYYNSGSWRASWEGEGGGILLNQCPHNLDLLQWFVGMPCKVYANCEFGKYHNIEVEDEVNAILTFKNGAKGIISVNTGEYPGTQRLEVAGELGKLVYEKGTITVMYNGEETTKFSHSTEEAWGVPEYKGTVAYSEKEYFHLLQHATIIDNVSDAIEKGTPLIAPAEEGINSVELANSMILSTIKGKEVSLPLDPAEYAEVLENLKKNSKKK